MTLHENNSKTQQQLFFLPLFLFYLKSFHTSDIRLILQLSKQHDISGSYIKTISIFYDINYFLNKYRSQSP